MHTHDHDHDHFTYGPPQIFGFQTAELDRVSDGAVVKLLERVYDVFDDQKIDKLDWRTWLVMYALLSKYEVMTREHLVWGFSMYASHGSIDLETTQAVPFTAIRAMFHFYTDENMRGKLMEAVDIGTGCVDRHRGTQD